VNFSVANVAMVVPAPDMAISPELRLRIISAVILAPITLGVVWAGGAFLLAGLLIAIFLLAREWAALVATPGGVISIAAPAVIGVGATYVNQVGWALVGLVVVGLVYRAVGRADSPDRNLAAVGPLYIGGACMALLWLRMQPDAGFGLVLWLFLVVWATDIGAYFVGRTLRGAKLAPAISPGKTWAGLVGGTGCAAVIGGGLAWLTGLVGALLAAVAGGALAVASQLGDLFESWLKRRRGVKDSGNLIPGHGGLLDRVDGLMTAAPGLAILAWLTKL